MADDRLVTELVVDARLANAGAAEFEQAARKIEQSSARAAAAVDALGQAIDRTGARMGQVGQRGGANAFDPQIAAATKYKDAIEELAAAHEQTIRKMQSGAFNVFDAQAALSSIASVRQNVQSGRIPEPGEISAMSFGRSAPVTVADVGPTVAAAMSSAIAHPGELRQLTRSVAQNEASDPTIPALLARTHAAEAVVAPSVAPAIARPAELAEEASLTPAMTRIASAIERVTTAEAARAAGSSGAFVQSASLPAEIAAYQAAAPQSPPRAVTGIERESLASIAGAEAQGESAASIAAANAAHTAATAAQRDSEQSLAQAAALYARGPTGVNVEAFNAARNPSSLPKLNEVDVEAWNKARQGTDSFWGSLKNLFAGTRAGVSDIHAASEATEGLAIASERAAGAGGRVREGFVIIRELFRGDLTRLIGSTTIELQRFGLLGVVTNPIVLGIGAVTAAMGVLIYRASEVQANIRSFDATLRTMGTSSQASGAGLQHIVEDLHHLGLSAEDAKKSVDVVARTPGLQPSAFPQIANLGARASQFLGGDAAKSVEELTKAVRGGVEGLIQYGAAYNAFSFDEINALRSLDRAGQSQVAFSRALDDLDHVLPHTKDLFSDFHNTVQELKNSWDEMLTSLSKAPAVEGTIKAITSVLQAAGSPTGANAITGAVEGAATFALTRGTGLGIIPRIGIGAAGGGALGAIGSPFLQSVAGGAALGATAGSLVPGVGTAAGAGAGAIAGGVVATYEAAQNSPDALADAIRKGLEASGTGYSEVVDATHGQTDASKQNTEALNKLTENLPVTTASEASTRTEADRTLGGLPQASESAAVTRLVEAVIQAESRGRPEAVSPTGAVGLMQVLPSTGAQVVPGTTREQLFNPAINVPIGTEYLRRQIEQFGSVRAGLEAYNAGPEAYRRFSTGVAPLPRGTSAYAENILRNAGLTGNETAGQIGFGLSGPTVAATPTQEAEISKRQAEAARDIAAAQFPPGYQQQRESEANRQLRQAEEKFPGQPGVQDEARRQAIGTYDELSKIQQQHDTEDRERAIKHAQDIAAAGKSGIEAELRARAEADAFEAQRRQGGAGVDTRAQEALALQAIQGLASGHEQLQKEEETRVHSEQEIAAASQISRAATIQATIATEAHAFALDELHRAGVTNIAGLREEALALERNKAAHLQSIEAAREEIEAGSELQRNRDRAQGLTLQTSLVGQGSIETERQLSYLRTQQEIAQRYSQASPQVQAAVAASSNGLADMNAQLAEAEQHQQRINELFHGIANTVDNDLGNALRNALIRTPAEAGEHIKNYWQELRTSIKSILGDIVSGIAEIAFIKPATSAIASGLGLGQVAQQIGGFGGAPAGGLGNASLTFNVSGVSSGATVTGPGQGGTVNQSGTVSTVLGGVAAAGTLPEGAAATSQATAATTGAPTTAPLNLGNISSGLGLIDKLNNNLPGFLPSFLSGGSSSGIGSFLSNPFGLFASPVSGGGPIGGIAGAPFSETVAGPGITQVPGIFGTTATFGSFLSGAGAGFGAGALLNNILGGNAIGGTVGSAGGALAGAALGSLFPVVGTLLGGLIGGLAGGGLGGLIGGRPSGQSAGAVVGSSGQISFNDRGGSAANIQTSDQVSQQIASFVRALGQLTDAQGKPIGNVVTNAVVSSDNRSGIKVTGSNIAGGTFGQDAANAVTQTELQIVKSLTNVSGTLATVLQNINDPSQLQAAVQFADVYDKLNVTSAELTANLNGNVNTIGPFSQALTQVNSTFSQLTSQAQQFGESTAPIGAALTAVSAILNQDFKINVAEALSSAIDGGNDFIASLVKIHQTYEQNINDAQALSTGVPTGVTPGFAGGTMGSASGTPSGWIIVGERGPEWMFQPGGATVLPNGQQPSDVPDPTGRSFASGTIGAGDVAGQLPGIGSLISEASGGPSLLGAAGGVLGLSSDTLSTIGDVLPIAGPLVGGLLGVVTGHPVQGAIGTAASLLGFALGGPIGGVIGGLAGLLGNLIGPKPSNNASGDLVDLATGAISGFQSAGDKNADKTVAQISAGLSAISTSFQAATGGTISGAVNVQDGKRDGIKTSYSGPQGNVDAKWGDVSSAIGQFGLAIAHNLQGIDPALQAQLSAIHDPNQLIATIENFTGKGIDLAAPSAPASAVAASAPAGAAAASAPGGEVAAAATPAVADAVAAAVASQAANDNAVSPQLALPSTPTSLASGAATPILSAPSDIAAAETQIAAERVQAQVTSLLTGAAVSSPVPAGYDPTAGGLYGQYDAYGNYIPPTGTTSFATGTDSTPPGWILVGEKGPEWLLQPGGATVLPNGVLPPDAPSATGRSFAEGTLSTSGEINAAISGTEAAQAGPVLATLGLDQLNTVIQTLGTVAPEIAAAAQSLINSGNALPDFLTQSIQALTDPLDLAIEKEKAAGTERVAIATQTGQDLVKAQQLTSANLVQAVISNLSNTNALNAIVYPGNTKALEYLQAAPTLAGLSGQQLTALASKIGDIAPDLASLAHSFIDTGTALPDTVTQALEQIANPLKLAIQQQAALAQARTQVADVTGQNFATTAALNAASTIQAVIQSIGNPEALQALIANGNPRGLAQLQAGPALAGLGSDQLSALLAAIGSAAPDLTAMINALTESGRALPTALVQATQAITQAGLLAIEKAQALGFEQVQGAAATGQSVPQAQQLAAAETALAVAQATNTQLPINGLPDWVTQLEEAVTAPLQLAIQKERAAGAERVQIAGATGADLVRVQQLNADAIAQIWYQATQQLTSLKNDLTTGSLSGLTAANQVTASIEHFNTVLGLVQGGNTNFIGELSTAGQNAVQAAQQAYGNGPQTASVREQVYQAISPFLVSASGYPTSGATAIAAGATTSGTATGTTTDLQANTTALQSLTTAITSTLGSSGAITGGTGGGSVSAASPASGTASGTGGATSAATTSTSGFSPNLTASLDNLMSQYSSLSPAMQAVYNGVVGSDNATFNSGAGLGNKVELAALLRGYQGLSPTAKSQYDAAISNNPAYSNTAAGIASKLSLVESLYPSTPAAVTPVTPVTPASATSTPADLKLTSNPVTGLSFTGSGITAVVPNFPTFPSASTLSNALADAIASRATSADWVTINQAVQAGILDPAKQPGYALVIKQAQQFAAGASINPSLGLSQALSDALHGTPTLQEWALINQAVNAGILSPVSNPQYATVIRQARLIANAQAVSLSQIPNNETAYDTVIHGRPAFAAGTDSTPPGMIMVGEKGPEWYHSANDNMPWRVVGAQGPELLSQPGGATILPFPVKPSQRFAEGTNDWRTGRYAWASGDSSGTTERVAQMLEKLRGDVVKELQANRKQLMGGQMADDQNARAGHELTRQLVRNTGPNLSAPARRAVG